MLSETAPTEENACSFKEISSSMDPYCADENLSISLQSYDPFCVTSDGYFKSSAPLGTDDLVGAFSSLTIIESSGQKDDEGKDNVRFDGAFVTECPYVICSSPRRRSSRKCKTKQEVQKEKTAKKCRKTSEKKPSLDLILLKVARRRRSFLCKRARSSVWGILGNIPEAFEQNTGRDVHQNEHKNSGKGSRGRGSGKRSKNVSGGRSRKPKGKNHISTTGIRLKVKLGKQVVNQSCLLGMVPATEDGPNNFWETCLDFPKLSNGIEDKLEDKVLGIRGLQCCDEDDEKGKIISNASVLDMHIADKELENNLVNEKLAGNAADNHHPVPYQTEAGGLGLAVDSRYLDAGTSPDSEVINLIPDTQIGGRIQEDLHDILISSQDCDAPRYVRSLKLHRMNSKKGKKKGKLPQASCCTVEDGISAPEIINKSKALEKHGQRKKGEDICSTEVSIATIAVDASGNTSSSLPSLAMTDFGVDFESVKVENVTEVNPNSRLSVGLASPELQFTENLLTYTKSEGRKLPKCSKSSGASKRSAEKPDAVKSRTGNACRQKKNRANSVSKISEKDCEKVVCNVECHLDTGTYMVDDLEKNISNKSTSEGIFSSEVVPSGGSDQSLLPRNAWVRCDDCFKWRRIPATLADTIEETNCKWICKDNLDTAFADCSIPQEKSNSEINAELEISDASCEEDASDARMSSKRSDKKHLTVPQQSPWMLIKSNLFLHRSRKTQTIDEVMVCHCKLPPEGRMGCGDGCLNRMLNIECVKGTCPCGGICSNQQFQKRKYAKLRWFRCGKKGYGLQLLEDISRGQFLIEYVGEVLDMQAYEKRQREYAARGHKHFYFMTLNGSEVIDACAKGNLGRFINHSCDPNCRTEKWMVNGEVCIGLFALRDIKKGEEVTFDYNYVRVFGAAAKKCVCGSSQCRGFIGGDPLKSEVIVQGDSDDEYPEPVMINEDGEVDDNLDDLISASTSLDGAETQTSENILKDKAEMEKPATAFGHLVTTTRMQNGEILLNDRNEINKSTSAVGYSDIVAEYDDSTSKSAYAVSQLHISSETEGSERKLPSSLQPAEPSSQADDVTSKSTPFIWEDHSIADETINKSSSVQRPEISSLTTYHRKSLSDTTDMKKKSKSDTAEERHAYIKSRPRMKTFRSSSVKKGKSNSNSLSSTKLHMLANKSHVQPHKPKKPLDGSLSNRFEAVEEKLNELLDSDGGISKRKDAPKVYLKLLLLTAASGDSGNGEAIQSNRDLSMILDALLKTKSRMVLGDIINKNGLQMLHNIMKQYRRDFNKIPILRKLLKVLEYLALREILTLDHINGGPPCPGVESFRESILTLTEHDDKQVHQIARNFRDRWIPRSVRKVSCMERDDSKAECHRYPNCNRFSASHAHWRDQGGKSTETNDCIKQSTAPVDSCISEGCSASCSSGGDTNGTKIRKRKSRWDQPADPPRSPQHKELKIQHNFLKSSCSTPQPEVSEVGLDHINCGSREQKYCPDPVENFSEQIEAKTAEEGRQNMDEDLPPGFLPPRNGPSVSSNASSTAIDLSHRENVSCVKCPRELVMGFPQARFLSRVSLSYGIPISVLQQYGTPQAENVGRWIIAPGVPFHPFPPLPPYPREMGDAPTGIAKPVLPENVAQVSRNPDNFQPDQETPSTSGAGLPYFDIACANDQNNFQRERGSSNLGTRYFRQQKWNNTKFGPPWIRKRNGWAPMGNNFRGGMCSMGVGSVAHEFKGPYSSENVGTGVESSCNTFYRHP